MAVFGFGWEPHWTDGGAAATVDSVRTELQALPDDQREVGHGIGLRDDQLTKQVYQQVAETGRTLSDPNLTPEQRAAQIEQHQAAVDTGAAKVGRARPYREPDNRAKLEKSRELAHAIIERWMGRSSRLPGRS
jgi:hypothetical protein